MQLPEALRRQKQEIARNAPKEMVEAMAAETEKLKSCGIVENCLAVGDSAPDFTLRDHKSRDVHLYEQLSRHPVVLAFFRGDWCPYCNLELQALQRRHQDIIDAGARLLAVSPMRHSLTIAFADKLGLSFPVLSDRGNEVAAKYGLVFTVDEALQPVYSSQGIDLAAANGDHSNRLPLPATYIIDRSGIIVFRYADPDYANKLDPQRVVEVVRSL